MKQSINFREFREAFICTGRQNNFPGNGLAILWDYLQQLEEDLGEELELDVIGICCEYSQDHWQDIADNYSIDISEYEDDEEKKDAVIDYLEDNTLFIGEANDDEMIYRVF